MSNVMKVLKAEIARISKKEAKSPTQAIGKRHGYMISSSGGLQCNGEA